MMNKVIFVVIVSLMLSTTYAQQDISQEVNRLTSMCDQDLFNLAQAGIGDQYKEVHPTLGPSFHFSCHIQLIKPIFGNNAYYQVSVRSEETLKFYISDYYENETETQRILSSPNTQNLALSNALKALKDYIVNGYCFKP